MDQAYPTNNILLLTPAHQLQLYYICIVLGEGIGRIQSTKTTFLPFKRHSEYSIFHIPPHLATRIFHPDFRPPHEAILNHALESPITMFPLLRPIFLSYRLNRPLSSTPSCSSTLLPSVTLPCRRTFHLEGLMLAPVLFSGLFVSLWTWKCLMMVAFQNKIIYMPGLPPNARREKISDYASRCGGLQWREERVRSVDGTDLALCVTDVDLGRNPASKPLETVFYILYFQGAHIYTSAIYTYIMSLLFT